MAKEKIEMRIDPLPGQSVVAATHHHIGVGVVVAIVIFADAVQGVPKKEVTAKILTKNECCGAKFSHRNDLGVFDPVQSQKQQKDNVQAQGVPATGDWCTWIQQHSVNTFFWDTL